MPYLVSFVLLSVSSNHQALLASPKLRAYRTQSVCRLVPCSTPALLEMVLQARVFDTPGHTRGHITFWFPEAKALFPGDTAAAKLSCQCACRPVSHLLQHLSWTSSAGTAKLVMCPHTLHSHGSKDSIALKNVNLEWLCRFDWHSNVLLIPGGLLLLSFKHCQHHLVSPTE